MSADQQNQEAQGFSTSDNPLPEGSVFGFVETKDGAKLRYAHWEAELRPSKGTVILLHGRSECIEKYFETVGDLRRRGFGVLTFDWRGQGGSSRLLADPQKGYIENFNQYLVDLETILTDIALPDCKAPFYILAHSTGGLVALLAAPALTNRIRRMVVVAPLLALNNLPMQQSTLHKLVGFFTFIGLGRKYISAKRSSFDRSTFISNKLTSDKQRFDRNMRILKEHPQLAISAPTITWLFAACRAMEQATSPGFCNEISIPTLLVAPGNDAVVDPAAVENLGFNMRSGAYLTVAGAKHELMQEKDIFREQFFAAFDAFVPGTEI